MPGIEGRKEGASERIKVNVQPILRKWHFLSKNDGLSFQHALRVPSPCSPLLVGLRITKFTFGRVLFKNFNNHQYLVVTNSAKSCDFFSVLIWFQTFWEALISIREKKNGRGKGNKTPTNFMSYSLSLQIFTYILNKKRFSRFWYLSQWKPKLFVNYICHR